MKRQTLIYRLRVFIRFVIDLDFIYLKISDQTVANSQAAYRAIPNRVFSTARHTRVPRKMALEVRKFRRRNSDFEFILFNHKQMTRFTEKNFQDKLILDAFTSTNIGVVKSDIFRYCYAYIYGRIYLDLTKHFNLKLRKIFPNDEVRSRLTQEKSGSQNRIIYEVQEILKTSQPSWLVNWCFASAKGNQLIAEVIHGIEESYLKARNVVYEDVKLAIWELTGPIAFTKGILFGVKKFGSSQLRVDGCDFGETIWPKLESSKSLNIFRRHYSEYKMLRIFH
jgi:mannosyltransferase OCH1-like enzyme